MPLMQDQPKNSQSNNLERERLTSLINSMSDGVIATDGSGKIAIYNASALNILDRNTSMEGQWLSDMIPIIDKNNQAVDVRSLIRSAKVPIVNRDYRLHYQSDNSIINLYISISPVHLGYGKSGQGGYVVVLRDITKEKSLEEERDEFISVTSHELRTPIAIAEGNVSNVLFIMDRGADPTELKSALQTTYKQILFLNDLINDLATLSRAEQGKLMTNIEPINPHELIIELVENYRSEAEGKGLTLKTDIDPKLELLSSSKLYVKEVLQNFITNSIKYTEKGSVTLGAKSQENGVLFTVADTGIGISKSDQTKIFNKFFRSEDYRTRQSKGTGLGLYVTAKLAKLIKADIHVTSILNYGSTFSIFVPNQQKQMKSKILTTDKN